MVRLVPKNPNPCVAISNRSVVVNPEIPSTYPSEDEFASSGLATAQLLPITVIPSTYPSDDGFSSSATDATIALPYVDEDVSRISVMEGIKAAKKLSQAGA